MTVDNIQLTIFGCYFVNWAFVNWPKKYGDKQEVEIIVLACSNPPQGRARWSSELLTEKLNHQKGFKSINRETIRLILKKRM